MSDQPKKDRPLSEISHLFLSSMREKQGGGAPRPQRKPPAPRPHGSIDLTPEEFAQVFGESESSPAQSSKPRAPGVTAVIATHLNGKLFDRVKEYAAHLCGSGARIGMIEVDAAEFRVMLFERNAVATPSNPMQASMQSFDLRRMSETIEELS